MKLVKNSFIFNIVFAALLINTINAQERDEMATLKDFNGLEFKSQDSSIYMNFRFRMQNRLGFSTIDGNRLAIRNFDARVRRLRMRVDGYLYSPKLSYSVQLAFTRGDQDIDDTGIPNIVRDAVVFYNFTPNFYVAFGLNKLPGNRQRVNSSGQLQFADRSIVSAAMNIDRDFGVKAYYKGHAGDATYHLKGAVTTGEGRVANNTDRGLAYTGRVEFLPMGDFIKEGDYSEGDLYREPTPKLSIAAGYSINKGTTRSGGQIGYYLYSPVDLGTFLGDAILKYNGWAYSVEYLRRTVSNPFTYNENGEMLFAFAGEGFNHQLSYLFMNNYELAGRYSRLIPTEDIRSFQNETEIVELGLTKYLNRHRIKMQLNAIYHVQNGIYDFYGDGNRWGGVFQIELGI